MEWWRREKDCFSFGFCFVVLFLSHNDGVGGWRWPGGSFLVPQGGNGVHFYSITEREESGTSSPFWKFVNSKDKTKTETLDTLLFHSLSTFYSYFPYLHSELSVKIFKSSWVNSLITFSDVDNVKLPGTNYVYFPETLPNENILALQFFLSLAHTHPICKLYMYKILIKRHIKNYWKQNRRPGW